MGIFDDEVAKRQRQNSDRDVNAKNPSPFVVHRQITAESFRLYALVSSSISPSSHFTSRFDQPSG
jgi:hypothetical protein